MTHPDCPRQDPALGTLLPTAAGEGNGDSGLSLGDVPRSLVVQHVQALSSCRTGGRGAG